MRTLRRAYASILLLAACAGGRAAAAPCPGVAPETAKRVFGRIEKVDAGAGYRFESLNTKESAMTVLWTREGRDCPPIIVDVENCDSPLGLARFRLRVPAELSRECPGLAPVVQELSRAIRAEHPVGQHLPLPPWAERPFWAGIALVLGAGLAIRRLIGAPGKRRMDWGDAAWIAFILVLGVLAHRNVLVAVTLALGTGWLALALLLCERRLLAIESRFEIWSLLALFALALAVRVAWSSGGPGDLHLNLAAIWSNELDLRWGPAPIAGFRILRLVLDVQDGAILWCNIVLGSLVPILVCAVLAQLGVGTVAALSGAILVACHPIAIVFAGVLGRQPAYLFAAFGSLLALVGFLKYGAGRYLAAFVLATVLAATSRPEGAQVLIPLAAALLFVPSGARRRAAAAMAVGLLGLGAFLYVANALPPRPPHGTSFRGATPFLWTMLLRPEYTPAAWIAVWMLGLIVAVRERAAWIAILTLAGLDLAWRWSDLYHTIVGIDRHVAATRYQTILLMPFAIGAALLVQTVRRAGTRVGWGLAAVLAVATAVTFRAPYATLLRPFTVDHEYRFLRKYALSLPPRSRLYVLDPPFDDMGFIDAHLVGEFVRSPVRFAYWSERSCEDLSAGDFLYIGSVCAEVLDAPGHPLIRPAYEAWLAECASIRGLVRAGVVEEVDVAARKMSWHDFAAPTARLGLYQLNDPSVCARGWRSRFHAAD